MHKSLSTSRASLVTKRYYCDSTIHMNCMMLQYHMMLSSSIMYFEYYNIILLILLYQLQSHTKMIDDTQTIFGNCSTSRSFVKQSKERAFIVQSSRKT